VAADTKTEPDDADLSFIIPPGTYSYVSCDGGTAKPIPGTYHSIDIDRSIQTRIYDLWLSPVNGLYGCGRPPSRSTTPAQTS